MSFTTATPVIPPLTPGWRPKAIIFDLLTALLDSWSLWDKCTPSATAEEGRLWRGRYLELTFGAGAYVPYETLVQKAASDVGLSETAPMALLRDWEMLQPWDDVPSVLEQLRSQGYRLGVVTNCSQRLGHIAAHRAGENVFDTVVTAEGSGYYKPVEEAYRAALTEMNVDAGDVLFVAGSAGDVEGATKAGMKVVWHNKVGLAKKGTAIPLKEAKTLRECLRDFM